MHREGGEEAQKQSYTDSELIMSNSTTVINTPWQDVLTRRSLSTAYNISCKQLTRPPGRNVLAVSIINSCVVAHQFAIVSVQRNYESVRHHKSSQHIIIYSISHDMTRG